MNAANEWSNWESGDCLYAPDTTGGGLPLEIAIRLKSAFQQTTVDWNEGNRWVVARIRKAVEVGYQGALLEAEKSLLGRVALVSVADASETDAVWVKFYLTPDTGTLELRYEPSDFVERCRTLATKIGQILGYEFERYEDQ